jgi:hypothetical protein
LLDTRESCREQWILVDTDDRCLVFPLGPFSRPRVAPDRVSEDGLLRELVRAKANDWVFSVALIPILMASFHGWQWWAGGALAAYLLSLSLYHQRVARCAMAGWKVLPKLDLLAWLRLKAVGSPTSRVRSELISFGLLSALWSLQIVFNRLLPLSLVMLAIALPRLLVALAVLEIQRHQRADVGAA